MNFFEYRAQKYAKQSNFADGSHTVCILEAKELDDLKFYVKFEFQDGKILSKKFTYNVNKYTPFDALIDSALGRGTTNFKLQELVGKHVEIELLNNERFTNILRIRPVTIQEQTVDDFIDGELDEITAEEF
ncbi:hypothetical protein D3C75_662640 [compost metagenome]